MAFRRRSLFAGSDGIHRVSNQNKWLPKVGNVVCDLNRRRVAMLYTYHHVRAIEENSESNRNIPRPKCCGRFNIRESKYSIWHRGSVFQLDANWRSLQTWEIAIKRVCEAHFTILNLICPLDVCSNCRSGIPPSRMISSTGSMDGPMFWQLQSTERCIGENSPATKLLALHSFSEHPVWLRGSGDLRGRLER